VYRTFQHAPEPAPGGGGQWWKIDSTNFPVAKTIASTYVVIEPKGVRELHWHPTVSFKSHILNLKRLADVPCDRARSGCTSILELRAQPFSLETATLGHSTSNLAIQLCSRTTQVPIFRPTSQYHALVLTFAGHYIENTSATQNLTFIEIYKSERVADVSLTQWLALTPADIVANVLKIPLDVVLGLKKEKQVIVHGSK
jgi:oxalate decarboxylase